jgi:hypothetical protein
MSARAAAFQAKLDLAAEIITRSGGISVWALSRSIGESQPNTKRIVRQLRIDGRITFSNRREERDRRRGPPAYLLEAVKP